MVASPPIIAAVFFSSIEDYPVDLVQIVHRSIVPGGTGFYASSMHVH